jgi:hypothetical protein
VTFGASGGTLNLAGGVLTLGPDLTTSGAGSGITLSAGGAYTLTIPKTGTAVVGTGTSGSGGAVPIAYWSDTNTLSSDNAGLLYNPTSNRVGIGAAPSKTLEVNGDAIVGGGLISASLGSGLTASSGQFKASDSAAIGGSLTVGSTTMTGAAGAITASSEIATSGGGITTSRGVTWDMGGFTATVLPIVGYATVSIGGVARKVAIVN